MFFAALLRFGRGFQTRRLSASLAGVLRPIDHAWIILGVVAPIAIHPLAGYLRSGESSGFIESGGWVRGLLLIGRLISLPCLIAARRLGRRLACLGWNRCPGSEAVWLSTAAVTLGLVGTGGAFENEPALVIGAAPAIFLLVLGLLIFPIGVLFNPRATAIRWVTCCRAIGPALAAGILWIALSVPLHHAREKHWTEQNTLTRIDPGVPAMNRSEHELANAQQAEVLEILDRKP